MHSTENVVKLAGKTAQRSLNTISLIARQFVIKVIKLLVEETLLGKIDKEKIAIQRCIEFQNKNPENKNILAFSGGKDSIVAYDIIKRSGINFTPIYSRTSVDPPEAIWFMMEHYPEVIKQKYRINKKGRIVTMWELLSNRAMPPTRVARYCCQELKERTGNPGDTVFTGQRWAESDARRSQSMVNFYMKKIMVRPLVDWSDEDIWEYIHKYNIPYCELYDEGWSRLGCIGCPLGKNQRKELEAYPKYKAMYIRCFDRMIKYRKSKGMPTEWKTGEEVLEWWINQNKKQKNIEGQCSMF